MEYKAINCLAFQEVFLFVCLRPNSSHGIQCTKNNCLPYMFTITHIIAMRSLYSQTLERHWNSFINTSKWKRWLLYSSCIKITIWMWRFSLNHAYQSTPNASAWTGEIRSLNKKYFLFESQGMLTCDLIMKRWKRIGKRLFI